MSLLSRLLDKLDSALEAIAVPTDDPDPGRRDSDPVPAPSALFSDGLLELPSRRIRRPDPPSQQPSNMADGGDTASESGAGSAASTPRTPGAPLLPGPSPRTPFGLDHSQNGLAQDAKLETPRGRTGTGDAYFQSPSSHKPQALLSPTKPSGPATVRQNSGSKATSTRTPSAHVNAHQFERDADSPVKGQAPGNGEETRRICSMCRNLWDDGGSALFPYYRCGKCGVFVHAACRSFAQDAFSCPPPKHLDLRSMLDQRALNCHGVVTVRIRQAYDLPAAAGTSLYLKLGLLPWKERVKTPWAEMGAGKEVVWWTGEAGDGSSAREPKYSLVHLYNNESTPIPSLRVEVWSSAMQILDQMVCYIDINMLPAMAFPRVEAERWHRLDSGAVGGSGDDGAKGGSNAGGMILLSTSFTPTKSFVVAQAENTGGVVKDAGSLRARTWSADGASTMAGDRPGRPPEALLADHLFKLQTYVKPTFCGVCEVLLLGFTRQGYRCEICGLDVHRQCQLQANLQQPCPGGQSDANAAADKAVGVGVAPDAEQNGLSAMASMKLSQGSPHTTQALETPSSTRGGEETGVGQLTVVLLDAHRCSTRCGITLGAQQAAGANQASAGGSDGGVVIDGHCLDMLDGDHYCRVRLGDKTSRRTRTVYQTANPRFEERWKLVLPYYRASLVVELIDAAREKPVGKVEVPVFKLLQRDADASVEGRDAQLEDEYALRDGAERVVGFVRMRIAIEEDMKLFTAAKPRRAPAAPTEELGVDNLKRVIDRFQALVAYIQLVQKAYVTVMSWKTPPLTGTVLVIFVYLCLFADLERIGAYLAFIVLLIMTYAYLDRCTGRYRRRWVEEDTSNLATRPGGPRGFRGMAKLRMLVDKARFPVSRSHEAKGVTYVTVSYAVKPEAHEVESDIFIGCCSASSTSGDDAQRGVYKELDVEYTLPFAVASTLRGDRGDNVFRNVVEFDSSQGGRGGDSNGVLLHRAGSGPNVDKRGTPPRPLRPSESLDSRPAYSQHQQQQQDEQTAASPIARPSMRYAVVYPMLQPVAEKGAGQVELQPFSHLTGFIRLRAFQDPTGMGTLEEEFLGQAVIPVRSLVEAAASPMKEYSGWLALTPPQWQESFLERDAQELEDGQDKLLLKPSLTHASLQVRAVVSLPEATVVPSREQIDESLAVEAMLEENTAGQAGGPGVVSSLWNLRSTVRYIQNLLEQYLGLIESVKNLLIWTHPRKTAVIYGAVFVGWLVLIVVPTRYLILAAGLSEFLCKFFPEQREFPNATRCASLASPTLPSTHTVDGQTTQQKQELPNVIRCNNLLASIPNDEDVRRVYYWENQEYLKNKRQRLQSQKERRAMLRGLWGCLWEGDVLTRASSSQPWKPAYVLVQGNRVLWWKSERDLDKGSSPDGQIVLRGHAGIASPSPVELKELGPEKAALLVCVFGRNIRRAQEKRSFLTSGQHDPQALREALERAFSHKQA